MYTHMHTGFVEDTSFSWCAMACFAQQHREQQPLSLFKKNKINKGFAANKTLIDPCPKGPGAPVSGAAVITNVAAAVFVPYSF